MPCARISSRRWYAANKERANEHTRKWYKRNGDKNCEKSREWRAKYPEKSREQARKKRRERPAQAFFEDKRTRLLRRARDLGLDPHLVPTVAELRNLFAAQAGRCPYTGKLLDITQRWSIALDHKTPLSRGGTNAITNLQFVTGEMNVKKNARTDDEFRQHLHLKPLSTEVQMSNGLTESDLCYLELDNKWSDRPADRVKIGLLINEVRQWRSLGETPEAVESRLENLQDAVDYGQDRIEELERDKRSCSRCSDDQ